MTDALKMHRTLLFAPGSRPDLLAKAQIGVADAMIFDLEDSVAATAKDDARANVLDALRAGLKKPMYLRINNPQAGDCQRDLAVLAEAGSLDFVEGVILPKAELVDDIATVEAGLSAIEKNSNLADASLAIIPLIETCLGLRHTFELATASARVRGMALASAEQGDFMVDLGGHWTPRSLALAYPRSKMVVDARAAGVAWLIDGVFMNLGAADTLRTECRIARELGFVAKMAIHPSQVDIMQQEFSPSPEELEFARGLLAAFQEAEAQGVGAVKYRGMMVDYANVRLAQRTLALAGAEQC